MKSRRMPPGLEPSRRLRLAPVAPRAGRQHLFVARGESGQELSSSQIEDRGSEDEGEEDRGSEDRGSEDRGSRTMKGRRIGNPGSI